MKFRARVWQPVTEATVEPELVPEAVTEKVTKKTRGRQKIRDNMAEINRSQTQSFSISNEEEELARNNPTKKTKARQIEDSQQTLFINKLRNRKKLP